MPSRAIRVSRAEPLFDLGSFGRRGPERRDRLSPAEIQQIVPTASRVPEVVVKVSGGSRSAAGAIAHLRYIDRNGELDIETDEGERLKGRGIEKDITSDWELEAARAHGRGPYRGKGVESPQSSSTT